MRRSDIDITDSDIDDIAVIPQVKISFHSDSGKNESQVLLSADT